MSKKRRALLTILVALSAVCALSIFRLNAADPTAGTIMPTSTPASWNGTAAGGTGNGEETCVEGVNCDTFTLTVAGTPADWAGKRIQIAVSWIVLASDYDVYIHKTDNNGPIVDQSAHGAPSTSETAFIEPATDGTGVFTVHVVYFTSTTADQYHGVATVVTASATPPPPPPVSAQWNIRSHGTCCEGNLAAAGDNTFILLPVLVQGNKILKSADGGSTWTQKYPPAPTSVPFGIEGDMQAFGTDVIYFGTELGVAVTAHSDDMGETFTAVQNPLASAGNDQAWSYLGPFGDLRPGGPLPTDEPYVLAGWMRIGSAAVFSFDGGLTFPIQTPLVGNNGSGPINVVCRESAHAPNDTGDTRIANQNFARQKSGRHGSWGTDRKFYWTEPADGGNGGRDLYVCKTDNFGTAWTGIKHPVVPGPASNFVVSHSAFDNNGTLYVLHGDKLYVSFNQGESFAFTHTLPRYGNAGRSDAGSDQFFAVDCGTIHLGLMTDAGESRGNVFYLRGSRVDTATPIWDEELVDVVENNRLDFMQIVLNGNGIPTLSYTRPGSEVTTASRNAPMPVFGGNPCTLAAVSAVSRKFHGSIPTPFDIPLPFSTTPGIECRSGGPNGEYQIVVNFATPITLNGATVSAGMVTSATANGNSITINLANVPNAQTVTVNLMGVSDGSQMADIAAPMGVLLGDTTANGSVNSSDVGEAKTNSGQTTNAQNFRTDVTVNGAINSSDVGVIKAQSGSGSAAAPNKHGAERRR